MAIVREYMGQVMNALQPGLWRKEQQLTDVATTGGNTSTKSAEQQKKYLKDYYNSVGRMAWQDKMI